MVLPHRRGPRHYPPDGALPLRLRQGWVYRECAPGFGAADLLAKIAYVPMDGSIHSRNIRLHELAHIIWSENSPAWWVKKYRLRLVESYQAAEDARIQRLLTLSGLDLGAGFHPPEQVRESIDALIGRHDALGCCLMLVAASSSGCHELIRRALESRVIGESSDASARVLSLAEEAVTRIARDPADPRTGARVARFLEKGFSREGWLGRRGNSPKPGSVLLVAAPRRRGRGRGDGETSLPDAKPAWVPEELDELERLLGPIRSGSSARLAALRRLRRPRPSFEELARALDAGPFPDNGDPDEEPAKIPWGTLKIEEPPRVRALPGRLGRGWQPSREGYRLNAPHRLLLDEFVFARRGRAQGGTVLIDVSGSMHLSDEDVWAVVEAAPGATVAVYAGNGDRGTLRVLARKGRVVAREACRHDHIGRMNVVDGPALRWLAAQPLPRIWISDGNVSGIGDRSRPGNAREAIIIVRSGGIERIPIVEQAVDRLRRGSARPAPAV